MLFLGVIFQSLISFFVASFFNLSVLFFISFFAFVIFNIQVLSLFKAINAQNILILTLIELIICTIFWIRRKKPVLNLNLKSFFIKLKDAICGDKCIFALFFALVFALLISFFLALLPPNEADASSYHCLRALFWSIDGFISHFQTADVRCHSMPINSELFYVWILSLSKNDIGLGLLQFFSYFLLIISSFKIMEFYDIEFNKRIWSILIFSSFAGVISQISSTQTDLLAGSLLTSSLYLILEFKKQNKINLLYFSSLSMAISFGVKSTAIIASLPLLIWYILLLKRHFIKYFLFLILNFSIFSSYNYILNLINYNSPLGAKSAINEHSLYFVDFKTFILGCFANLLRYIFSVFDFSGVAPFYLLSPIYDKIVHFVFGFFNIPILLNSNAEIPKLNAALFEHTMGLGLLSFLFVLPVSIMGLFDKKFRHFVVLFIVQTLLLSSVIVYFPTTIRFFISFLVFLIPVFHLLFKQKLYKKFITFIAFLYLLFVPLFLVQRPFLSIFHEFIKTPDFSYLTDNIRDLRYGFYNISKSHILLKDETEKVCAANKIGLFLSESFMAYPIKFLDFKNKCQIDFLLADNLNNADNYDFLIYDSDLQEISATIDFNNTYNCKVTDYMGRPTGKICYVDINILKNKGFLPYKIIQYKADSFLKNVGVDNDKVFFVLKKY